MNVQNQFYTASVAADFAKTNDTTLADVTGLTQKIYSGRRYAFMARLFLSLGTTLGGYKIAVNGPTVATTPGDFEWSALVWDPTSVGVTPYLGILKVETITTVGTATAQTPATSGADKWLEISGLYVPNADGTFAIQAAQNASDSGPLKVLKGSWVTLWPTG